MLGGAGFQKEGISMLNRNVGLTVDGISFPCNEPIHAQYLSSSFQSFEFLIGGLKLPESQILF